MLPTTQGMRQRGAYVATETPFVNPHSQEISAENVDCDKEARQGALGTFYVKIALFFDGLAPQNRGIRPPGGQQGEIGAEDLNGSAGR